MRGSFSRGSKTIVDNRDILQKFDRLAGGNSKSKANLKQACKVALEVVDKETMKVAGMINWKTQPNRAKPFRKSILKKSSYRFVKVKSKRNKFWYRDMINYKKPANKIAHLIERGWNHTGGKFITGRWFRKTAFENSNEKAMRVLLKGLNISLRATAEDKKISLKNMRKEIAL